MVKSQLLHVCPNLKTKPAQSFARNSNQHIRGCTVPEQNKRRIKVFMLLNMHCRKGDITQMIWCHDVSTCVFCRWRLGTADCSIHLSYVIQSWKNEYLATAGRRCGEKWSSNQFHHRRASIIWSLDHLGKDLLERVNKAKYWNKETEALHTQSSITLAHFLDVISAEGRQIHNTMNLSNK